MLLRPTKIFEFICTNYWERSKTIPTTNKIENCLVLDFTPATTKFNKGLANLFELFELSADTYSRDNLEQFVN